MKEKIVLFTANVQGGILQFTLQIYKTMREEGYDVKVCMPLEIKNCDLSQVNNADLFQYHKAKSIFRMTAYKNMAKRINDICPDYVWYMDDSVICSHVGRYLAPSIKQLLTLHDAGTHHPSNQKSLRNVLLFQYTNIVNKFFYQKIYRFVLLSPESFKTFTCLYPQLKDKAVTMILGAHLPQVDSVKPKELTMDKDFLLFFGRIDKYKGISTLIRAYREIADQARPLVIAGNGPFSEEEQHLIHDCSNLVVIHRYIEDGEMKWLFQHMTAAVLPYIEATQSGIIPLAYLFGKPVIVSDVAGLTQFVIDGKTGIVCKNVNEWKVALRHNGQGPFFSEQDYHDKMEWNKNIRSLFKMIEENN